jgi:Bacterial toxin homologue of phage lysozyme, C-term
MTTFQFPIRKADGSQFQDAEPLHTLLERETSGHYLLSDSGYWHSGIHISDESAPHCVFNEPVRCIADGEVVAYRLNERYQTSHVDAGLDAPLMKYSTSFCLVRHKYQSPPNPEEGPNFGKQNELTFYSLYMHLLPFEEYQREYSTQRFKVISGDWPARNLPKGEPGSQVLGNIPNGMVFDVIEGRDTAEGYHFTKGKIVEGRLGRRGPGDEVWFASKKGGEKIRDSRGRLRLDDITPQRKKPTYWLGSAFGEVQSSEGMVLYRAPVAGQQVTPIDSGLRLPKNSNFRFDSEKAIAVDRDNGSTRRLAPCSTNYRNLPMEREPIPEQFWAFVDDQTIQSAPSEPVQLDRVVVPDAPVPIKAGDSVGFLGLYEIPDGASKQTRHQVHLEVFACDPNLDAFLDNKAGLKQGKQYLEVLGLQPAIVGRARETTHPSFLFRDHVFDLKKLPIERNDNGKECYKITAKERARTPNAPLQTLDAYVTKQSALEANSGVRIISQYDLRAIGFKVVEQRQRDSCSPLDDENVCRFYAQLNAMADINSDGKVTPDELRENLKNPEFRDRWSKLVVRHHTEWQSQSDATCLQPFRDGLSDEPDLLRHECERIDQLVFWDEVAGKLGLPADGWVSYFHPVEFIGSFLECPDECIVETHEIETTVGIFEVSKKLFEFILQIERYREFPYALEDNNSGITIGYGYDLGQQTSASLDRELAGLYTSNEIEALKAALGKKGASAREYVSNLSHISISKENALKLAVIMKARYAQQVVNVYPKSISLHPDCQGVLLSLVINRGNALTHRNPTNQTRVEMNQIKEDFDNNQVDLIPFRLRSMKRLWEDDPSLRGVAIRREQEAVYFEEALKCDCWK